MPTCSDKHLRAQNAFQLLRSVHHLFRSYLPTIEDTRSGRNVDLADADLANDITILRSDIKSLSFTIQHIDIDQCTSDASLDRMIEAFHSMLQLLEDTVQEAIHGESALPQNADCDSLFSLFPKLVTLRNLEQQSNNEAINMKANYMNLPKAPEYMKGEALFGSYNINFPPPQKTIGMCRGIVESFGKAVAEVFPNDTRRYTPESQLGDITDAELDYLREAHAFSKISSSLFSLLIKCITCQAEHFARLHLFGFHKRQMEILLGTGEQGWVSACFTHCEKAAASEPGFSHRMCAHHAAAEYENRTIQGIFDGTALWEDYIQEHAACDLNTAANLPSTLDHFIQPRAVHTKSHSPPKLDRKGRKIIGVLLAYSLFQLCGSPWLQREFEGRNILVLPSKASVNQLGYWRPYISCDLSSDSAPRSLAEDVAALGVLVLELEANSEAKWSEEDEDYETGVNSNRARLSRILKEWKGDLPDRYHGVGSACFLFEQLAADFDHPGLDQSLKDLAILYKCIVNPLFRQLVSDFGDAERLFQGISALSVPVRQKHVLNAGQLVLYDDQESAEPDEKSQYADEFMEALEDSLLGNVRALRQNPNPLGLAEIVRGERTPEKVRIAVLDTGIDTSDWMIKSAMKKNMVEARSWVGARGSFHDTYGHGTHVARLLIEMAPSAKLFVAKITDNKYLDPKDMWRIAEAIDWALDEKVDIISMSFGFENENEAIDEAIDRAFKADKLIFAAASNEGGNKRRSRLGRSPSVICVHACDGKGNKGGMSPSPLRRKENFATLGVAVKSRWKGKTVYKSGTSFATPMAAAIAANVLEFANFKCNLSIKHRKLLYSRSGMAKLFEAISEERDGYDYVQPGRLWDDKDETELAEDIRDILAS